MPVSLQQFFNSANTVGDSASLFLQNGGESVGDTSSLHGIHKLSRSAKAEENRATVTAFLNALELPAVPQHQRRRAGDTQREA